MSINSERAERRSMILIIALYLLVFFGTVAIFWNATTDKDMNRQMREYQMQTQRGR